MLGEHAFLLRAPDDRIAGWSSGAARLTGFEAAEIVGRSLETLMAEPVRARDSHVTLRAKDGRSVEVLWLRTPMRDERGGLIAFVDVLVPEQDSALLAKAALAPPADARVIPLEALPMMCWIADPDGSARFMSARWSEYTGVPTERLLGMGWREVVWPDDLVRAADAILRVPRHPPGVPLLELRIRRHDGVYRWCEVRVTAQYDASGEHGEWIGATLDVHDMRVAREALQNERDLLTRMVATAPGAFFTSRLSPDGVLSMAHVSIAMQQMLDTSVEELNAGLSTLAHIHPEDRERVGESVRQSAATMRPWRIDFRMLNPRRGALWIQGNAVPMRGEDGTVQWFGFLQDVTERRRMEEVQLRSQKLEALGTLAGGIAHDFNNMLQAISGSCTLAKRKLANDHPAQTLLDAAIGASERAADLVRRLLQFSRPSEPHRELLSLRVIAREALRRVRVTLPAHIELDELLGDDDDDAHVEAGAAEIHQMIVDLVGNAVHAIGAARGWVRVRLETVQLDASDPHIPAGSAPGPFAALHVSDSGDGMDESTASRIFDPFFTTRAVGEGEGLGLSMVHGLMQSLGGSVTVHSAHGEGSTFTLYFPVRAQPPARSPSIPAASGERGDGCVLLLDDEPMLVELGTHALEALGYRVRAFTAPREALQAFLEDPSAIDAVLTDLAMPDLSGFDVARRLLQVRPDLPIVMMSGNVSAPEIAEARRIGLHDVLLKPVGMETLADVIAAAVRAGRTRSA